MSPLADALARRASAAAAALIALGLLAGCYEPSKSLGASITRDGRVERPASDGP